MSHNMGSGFDPKAGRYNGTDPATRQAFDEVRRNFENAGPDPVLVVAARAPQPGHYYVVELQGDPTSDGTAPIQADYGLQRGENVIVGINTFEQGLGTWWVNAGTTVDGSRRKNAGSNQLGVDTILFAVPFNYAGTHRADGGTGGATNTGGFGGGVGDGTSTGSGFDVGDDPNGGIGTGGGGGGTGSGYGPSGPGDGGGGGGGDLGGGTDGSCRLVYTVTFAGTDHMDGDWDCTWTGFVWRVTSGLTSVEIDNDGGGTWTVGGNWNTGGEIRTFNVTVPGADTCPPLTSYPLNGPEPGITCTVS